VLGDPRYLAPEVWQGEAVQATIDVYASGVLAYRLLTGAYPFDVDADARDAAQTAHHTATPAPASSQNPELSEAVDPVLQRALARHPGQRFRSGRDLATALREAITGEVSSENQSSPVDYTDQPTNRSPVWWLRRIGCTMLVGIWLVLIVFTCLLVTVLAQGEATFDFSDRPGHAIRVFDVQSEDKRGLGLSIGRLKEENDDRACIRTTVRYLMWEGSNEPTDYCECYNRADGEWYRGPEVDADCNPVAD
jgi:serine/threonine protein kinase